MKFIFFNLLLLLSYSAGFCQNPTEDFIGSWCTYSNHRISEHFSLSPYIEIRFYEPSSNYNLLFLSLRANYHLNKNQSIGLGYANLDIDTVFEFDNDPNVVENRLFEQYTLSHSLKKLKLMHRARLEQRFLNFADRNIMENRFRYRLALTYAINKTFFILLNEEPFVNFQDQVFHENRFYAGLGLNILSNLQFSVGYLKQHIRKNNLNRIQVGISFQTDSRMQQTTESL